MLSGSGLRTFGMVAAPEFLAPATGGSRRWKWLAPAKMRRRRNLLTDSPFKPSDCDERVIAKTVRPACCAGLIRDCSPWDYTPTGNGLLEGGRNSLLESAQQATLTSVATSAFPRQSNSLARTSMAPHCNRKFTHEPPNDRGYGIPARRRSFTSGPAKWE